MSQICVRIDDRCNTLCNMQTHQRPLNVKSSTQHAYMHITMNAFEKKNICWTCELAFDAWFLFLIQVLELCFNVTLTLHLQKTEQHCWLVDFQSAVFQLICAGFFVDKSSILPKSYCLSHMNCATSITYIRMAFEECKTCTFQRTKGIQGSELLLNPLLCLRHFPLFRCWFDLKHLGKGNKWKQTAKRAHANTH